MITKNKNEYLGFSRRDLLISPNISPRAFEKMKRKRLKKAWIAALLTMMTTVAVAIALILSCFVQYQGPYLSGGAFSFAKMIINCSFMDISLDRLGETAPVGNLINVIDGILNPSAKIPDKPILKDEESNPEEEADLIDRDSLYAFDYSQVPEGETPIIPMDLSMQSYGNTYIHNSTGLAPDANTLLNGTLKDNLSFEYLSSSSPTVLIIHTHGTEAYSEKGDISVKEEGEWARSEDKEKNVVAVGRALNKALKKQGINSIHCEIMHDADGYRDAYSRAEATIRQYLDKYPTIKLVIDVHRDAVIKSNGEIVRPVTVADGKAAAQIMCVVGSSWGGQANERWEGNLALALKLREELNSDGDNICRPPYLKSSTYNQEIAPYSLLIEVGACGNSQDEAILAAELTANALSRIILKK